LPPAVAAPGGSSRAMSTAAAVVPPRPGPGPRLGVTGVMADAGFQCVTRRGIPEGMISYKGDNGAWLNVAGITPRRRLRRPVRPRQRRA
jgi:hypothetical protein